jgi:uncharacterized LabA/DUF88 family protein
MTDNVKETKNETQNTNPNQNQKHIVKTTNPKTEMSQTVAILMDGNNIERSIHSESKDSNSMLNIDALIPKLLDGRALNRMIYFREGKHISGKLTERLRKNYHGSVKACHKSADIPLTIKATQLASKVDTIIIMSGDSDFVELVIHLQAMGVRVEVAAVRSTTSQLILDEVDFFHPITKDDWFSLGKRRPTKFNKNKNQNQSQNSNKSQIIPAPIMIEKKVEEVKAVEPETKKATKKKSTKKKVAKKVTKKVIKKVAKKVTKKKVAKKVTKKVTKKK